MKKTIDFNVTVPKNFNIFKNDWLEHEDGNKIPQGVLKIKSIKPIVDEDKKYNKFRITCEIIQPKYSCKEFSKKCGCCWIQSNRWEIYRNNKEDRNKFFEGVMESKKTKTNIAEADLRRANQGVKGCRL